MLRRSLALWLFGGLLIGCPPAETPTGGGSEATKGAATDAAPGKAGDPGLDAARGAPPPDGADTPGARPPGAGHRPPSEWGEAGGGMVKLSGNVTYAGSETGVVYVDFSVVSHDADVPPRVVHSLRLENPGAWEVEAPKGFGPVNAAAFIDLDDNGPGAGEPSGSYGQPIEIASADITGVDITIKDWVAAPDEPGHVFPPPEPSLFPDGPPPPPEQGGPTATKEPAG